MAYDLIKISALPAATPDESQEIVVGVGDYAKRINYGDVKADMVGTSPSYTTDTEPYLMRRTAHTGVVGKCALNMLVGGSLGWNQLVKNGDFTNGDYWSVGRGTESVSANTYTGISDGSGFMTIQTDQFTTDYVNHKLLIQFGFKASKNAVFIKAAVSNATINSNTFLSKQYTSATTWTDYATIYMPTATNAKQLRIGLDSPSSGDSVTIRKTMMIDLTAMFGSTIADYVYGLESATAGAGVAWLSRYIDLGTYHAYDAGSIQSVQATAHVTKDADDNVIGNYPLGSDTLRGVPQLVGNKLQFDGDIKTPDGTIRRRYGIVDLGTLTYTGDSGGFVLSESIGAKVQTTQTVMAKIICSKYPTIMQSQLSGSDKCVYGLNWGNGIGIRASAYSTPAAFKTAMSGVYLVYELATPTTESSTSYQKIQTIDADGTESFTTSSPVPVGNETQTPDNILAALEWLGE